MSHSLSTETVFENISKDSQGKEVSEFLSMLVTPWKEELVLFAKRDTEVNINLEKGWTFLTQEESKNKKVDGFRGQQMLQT